MFLSASMRHESYLLYFFIMILRPHSKCILSLFQVYISELVEINMINNVFNIVIISSLNGV